MVCRAVGNNVSLLQHVDDIRCGALKVQSFNSHARSINLRCHIDCSLGCVVLDASLNGGLGVAHHRLKEIRDWSLCGIRALEFFGWFDPRQGLEQVWAESFIPVHLTIEGNVVGMLGVHLAPLF